MSNWPLRFIHAGDFHLQQPLAGLAEVPDHLRDVLLDAPYRAAERVFDAVLREEADFLVLAGDLVAPQQCSPRALSFLSEQFERLADRETAVYWAGGTVDPGGTASAPNQFGQTIDSAPAPFDPTRPLNSSTEKATGYKIP